MGRHSRPDGSPPTTLALPATPAKFLIKPATDSTQVIPRLRPDVAPPWIADPDSTTTFAHQGATETDPPSEDVTGQRNHRSGWVWAGLGVFWLLALGAGLVTLASLGAPHYLCTGSASTGLACQRTGTVIAAVLTVVLITAVGSVSVLAIEARTAGRIAWRWLGIGVVVLGVVAFCGYLLIRTIGG